MAPRKPKSGKGVGNETTNPETINTNEEANTMTENTNPETTNTNEEANTMTENTNPETVNPVEDGILASATGEVESDLLASATGDVAEDEDEALFEKLVETKSGKGSRARDENSAFAKFRDYIDRMLKVAEKKGTSKIRLGRLVQGAVDYGIFNEVSAEQRYRRAYNYFTQQLKHLPKGWEKVSINGTNFIVKK